MSVRLALAPETSWRHRVTSRLLGTYPPRHRAVCRLARGAFDPGADGPRRADALEPRQGAACPALPAVPQELRTTRQRLFLPLPLAPQVKRCRYLEASGCKSQCINICKARRRSHPAPPPSFLSSPHVTQFLLRICHAAGADAALLRPGDGRAPLHEARLRRPLVRALLRAGAAAPRGGPGVHPKLLRHLRRRERGAILALRMCRSGPGVVCAREGVPRGARRRPADRPRDASSPQGGPPKSRTGPPACQTPAAPTPNAV